MDRLFWEGGWWRVCREPSAAPSPQALEEARRRAPEEFTLLERCGGRLGELLRGRREPLEVLMPGGDLTPLTRLYQDSPGPRALNQLVRRVVEVASRASSESRPLRILEVGGGTGGTGLNLIVLAEGGKLLFWLAAFLILAAPQQDSRGLQYIGLQEDTHASKQFVNCAEQQNLYACRKKGVAVFNPY